MIARGLAALLLLALVAGPALGEDEQTESLCANRSGTAPQADQRAACDRWIADLSERASRRAAALVFRAQLKARQRDMPGARADYDAALGLDPDNYPALFARLAMEEAGGDHAAALADSERALNLTDDPGPVHLARSRIFLALRRYPDAIAEADFDRFHSGAINFLNLRCWTRAVAGIELDKARTACNQALWSAPDTPALLDSRGLVDLKQLRWQAAWSDYDAALKRTPRYASALYGRGLAALKLGRDGRADLAAAAALKRDIAEDYAGYGLKP